MQTIVIIDYGSGNLRSAERAVAEAARAHDASVSVTSDPDLVRKADRVILPGVGAFGDCICGLNAIAGMRDALEESVTKGGKPFLGICVGMQLMAERGLEHGVHQGLGWISGEVSALAPRSCIEDPAHGMERGRAQAGFSPVSKPASACTGILFCALLRPEAHRS